MSGVQLLSIMKREQTNLSKLASRVEIYPQVLVNANVREDRKFAYTDDTVIMDAIVDLERRFGKNGRVLVRPSGTEPMVRVMIEGKNKKLISTEAKKISQLIEKRLA